MTRLLFTFFRISLDGRVERMFLILRYRIKNNKRICKFFSLTIAINIYFTIVYTLLKAENITALPDFTFLIQVCHMPTFYSHNCRFQIKKKKTLKMYEWKKVVTQKLFIISNQCTFLNDSSQF